MKVLIVNCVYGHGSTGKLIQSLHKGLINRDVESYVAYARGNAPKDPNIFKLSSERIMQSQALCSRLSGYVYACSPVSSFRLKRLIKDIKPNVVNLHCVNANTINVIECIKFLKEQNIPTVVTMHAEFLYTGGCGHALDCRKWLTGCNSCPQFKSLNSQLPNSWLFDKCSEYWSGLQSAYADFKKLRITCVSPWVRSRAIQSPFFVPEKVSVINNGVNVSIFKPSPTVALATKHGISSDDDIYLHVTPDFNCSIKGGKYVVEIAKRLKKDFPTARIIVVGKCDKIDSYPDNMIFVPHTSDTAELASYYSLAKATILTSERETFSMVTAESLCCGTPIVGFEAGGPESICTEGFAKFCKFGDVDTLYKNLIELKKESGIASIYGPIFSDKNMVDGYLNVYQKLLTER